MILKYSADIDLGVIQELRIGQKGLIVRDRPKPFPKAIIEPWAMFPKGNNPFWP
jgi:hypothetical protein